MAEEKDQKESVKPKFWDFGMMIALKAMDSGLGPWVLAMATVLCFVWLMTRNLNSADTLSLLLRFGTLKGLAWCGWGIAFLEVLIFKWVIDRTKRAGADRSRELEAENQKTRDHLKMLKQNELHLEQKSS